MRPLSVLMLLICASLSAATQIERGKLIENVTTRADPAQSYTLYLPTSHDIAKRHPLLLVFDPRGRGTEAAAIFQAPAEDLGWIVIGANGTRSDESTEPNERALRALYPEVLERFGADPKRLYAAGFSGTALVAWSFGINSGALAGAIGVGGRLVDALPPAKFSFAHYGFAGDVDFNNREMRAVDGLLDAAGKTHRFQSFPGDHAWITPELAREAMAWLEIIAMKDGSRERDDAFITRTFESDVAAAAALETSGRGVDAFRRYREIRQSYDGLRELSGVPAAIARLEADPKVRRDREDEATWDAFEERYVTETFPRLGAIFNRMRQNNSRDAKRTLMRELRVAEMQKRAAQPGAEGMAARRILEAIHAQMRYYVPVQLRARGEHAFAEGALAVAAEIRGQQE